MARRVFDDPERRNAVSLEKWRTVEQVLAEISAGAAIRVVVITGGGDRAFVSGGEISRFESEAARRATVAESNGTAERVSSIARIRGACIGGGVNLRRLLGSASVRRRLAFRRARSETRPGPRPERHRGPGGRDRPGGRDGDML